MNIELKMGFIGETPCLMKTNLGLCHILIKKAGWPAGFLIIEVD
jgi:hypothetical protein